MWARALRYIPAAPAEVLSEATRSGVWPDWLGLARADADRQLDTVGSRVPGALLVGWGDGRSVTWRVARRVRDIVGLEAVDGDGDVVAILTISCSWWDGACATELTLELDGRHALGRRRTERSLRRGLARLERQVMSGAAAGRAPRRAWRPRPAPRVAARLHP